MAKILIVDDEKETLDFASEVLKKEHDVSTTENWMQAIELIVEHNFDLIVMDINMPGLSGDKLAEVITNRISGKKVNIVLFSGIDEQDLRRKAEEVKAKGFIHKPCPAELFSIRVSRFLR